eukprot:scpid68732/ scgid19468/ Renin receptor; ATPase H(+)-transporting lysosomal accessory protein 2; ATPase H(+)-transporting lysosomal-interacting protein 2; ER-localized type I transmembrane adaptor; Embryonic liver differentiation factor 10; N14F; Renin/prorenin receptor; Vacuolar ATP synthase membrane sector-associated protein M8-9; Renin receptor; ATPase H(+)-transporting lysosomal accessory protein 2; ATPase H(+)-transporting lysosomal-interacting protein 2; Renin/prorenin receptor
MGLSTKLGLLLCLATISSCWAERSLFLSKSENTVSTDSKFSVLHAPGYVNFVGSSLPLPAKEVGAVSAFALGLAPSKTLTWDGLSPGSLFHRPKSNIMFVVDGVKPGESIAVEAQQTSKVEVDHTAPASLSVHAVAGGKSLGAHVSDLFHGSPLVLSMSADEHLASAAGAGGKNSVSMFYDQATQKVVAQPANSPMAMTTNQVQDNLATLQLPAGYKFDRNTMAIVSHGAPILSMSNKESASFLAELASLKQIVKVLSTDSSLVADNIPDVLTLTISSLKNLHVEFGSNSPQVKAAMAILSSVIPQCATELSKLYQDDAVVELVELAFDSEQFLTHAGDVSALYKQLKDHLKAQTMTAFQGDLPHIHLSAQASHEVACQRAQEALSGSPVKVVCGTSEAAASSVVSGRRLLSVNPLYNITSDDADKYNLAFVRSENWTAAFTMFLLVFLIFALSTLAIAYVLWTMDPGSDTVIYRMTNQRIKMD